MIYRSILKPLLFRMEADKAHESTYRFARMASDSGMMKRVAQSLYGYRSSRLNQQIWGLDFPNPIGLAAGFDKNGKIPELIEAAGFGFIEVGSITANPSTGNPLPRMFRLPRDRALINRMGLNNDGAKTVVKRLRKKNLSIPLGVNVAKTHDPEIMGDAAIDDYRFSYREACKVADYITLNISCPNTAEGKTFEDPGALEELLKALNIQADARAVPTLVKFSCDLTREELEALLDICESYRVHGYVATNTSSSREGLATDPETVERIGAGGLSGKPIAEKSVRTVQWISQATGARKPIIGVGGIDSLDSALAMIRAGADLLQVYTALIYEGPSVVKRINRDLVRHLRKNSLDSILQLPDSMR